MGRPCVPGNVTARVIKHPVAGSASTSKVQRLGAEGCITMTTPQPLWKEPPPEKPADKRRRGFVILSFWLIVVLLGLPIWWQTTTIYRADLPLQEMLDWAEGRV